MEPDLTTIGEIVGSSKHYLKHGYKITYCDQDLEHHDPFLNTLGLGHYTVGEIVHSFEKAYAEFWEQRGKGADAYDPSDAKYVAKFFAEYETPAGYETDSFNTDD